MNWGIEDVAAAVVLIGGTGAALALVLRTVRNRTARLLLAGGVILIGLLIWAHLAVGIF